jgi:glycosyltransferase involved in cell wall biosynthesis
MTIPTILIPAHNEASVIERTLKHMRVGMLPGEFFIVVIANACEDDTAAIAHKAAPEAVVIETRRTGKTHALNIGRLVAPPGAPIVFLDADLDVTAESLRALVAPLLQGKALATCGRMDVLTEASSPMVRAFYRGWRLNPYFGRGKFGGLFALSHVGAARVFPLPNVIADDEFIRRSFSQAETVFVPECVFTARAPKRLTNLISVRQRTLRGAQAIARMGLPSREKGSGLTMARRALRRPSEAYPFTVFAAVTAWTRLLLALEGGRAPARWERDMTSRLDGLD